MKQNLYNEIVKLLPTAEVMQQEPMSRHTTFRIGGCADVFVKVSDVSQLQKLIPELIRNEIPYYVIGKGSNLLVADAGFRGVILQLGEAFEDVVITDNSVVAGAGAGLAKVAKEAMLRELAGFEFAAGIPGSIGGGVIMNAGAYGGEMKDVVRLVRFLDEDGNVCEYSGEQMQFAYRNSALKNRTNCIVLQVELLLHPGKKDDILGLMRDLAGRRKEKQPLEYPSAGSTFKRPEGYFAGKLIGDAGLSGYRIGDAQVSEKHNGFVINKGNATAADVKALIAHIRQEVYHKFRVMLEPEVIFLGEFDVETDIAK